MADYHLTDQEYDQMRAELKAQSDELNKPKLKLFSCVIEWIDMGPSYFSILDTTVAGANSAILTRITHLGRSTSNIEDIIVKEVVGPFEKGFIIMEAL